MAREEPQTYLTSGQMAEANGVSRKALRVYREKGILEPHHVGPDSDRTFYDIRQSKKLDLVARLQGMGMSLDEIKAILDARDAGLPPSLFREINGLRSYGPQAYEADSHAVPRRDRVFVFVDEVYGEIWDRAEIIPAGQQLVLYQDRGYDENGVCVSSANIARMLDYMAAKHLVPCGAVREEVLFRFSHLLETDDGAILSRMCIPVGSQRAG